MQNNSTNGGGSPGDRSSRKWWHLLLIIPFIGLLDPQFYAFDAPRVFGWPFFYWYQFIWLFVTAGIVTTVYRMTR